MGESCLLQDKNEQKNNIRGVLEAKFNLNFILNPKIVKTPPKEIVHNFIV